MSLNFERPECNAHEATNRPVLYDLRVFTVSQHGPFLEIVMALTSIHQDFVSEEEAISAYFSFGVTHEIMRCFLKEFHDIGISIRTLRRRLQQLGLKRQKHISYLQESLIRAVQCELESSDKTTGYRPILRTTSEWDIILRPLVSR